MKMSVRQDFHFSEANKSQDLASNCIKSTNREISFKHKKKRTLAKILKKKAVKRMSHYKRKRSKNN